MGRDGERRGSDDWAGLVIRVQIFSFASPEVLHTWPDWLGPLGEAPFASVDDFLAWLPQPRDGAHPELISSEQMSMRHGRGFGPVAAAIGARQLDKA